MTTPKRRLSPSTTGRTEYEALLSRSMTLASESAGASVVMLWPGEEKPAHSHLGQDLSARNFLDGPVRGTGFPLARNRWIACRKG